MCRTFIVIHLMHASGLLVQYYMIVVEYNHCKAFPSELSKRRIQK